MRAEGRHPNGPAASPAVLLGWAACAGLCTLVLQLLAAASLPFLASPFPAPVSDAQVYTAAFVLRRMLAGPASETALLLPFAWAALHLFELRSPLLAQGAHCLQSPQGPRSEGAPHHLRLLGATGLLALPFTVVHVASQGIQAWAALPASCLVVLALLVPLRAGRPVRAAWSSFMVHSGHNALLLCTGWVLAWPV